MYSPEDRHTSSKKRLFHMVLPVRPQKSLRFLVSTHVASDQRVGIFSFLIISNCIKNCWIDWNSARAVF